MKYEVAYRPARATKSILECAKSVVVEASSKPEAIVQAGRVLSERNEHHWTLVCVDEVQS